MDKIIGIRVGVLFSPFSVFLGTLTRTHRLRYGIHSLKLTGSQQYQPVDRVLQCSPSREEHHEARLFFRMSNVALRRLGVDERICVDNEIEPKGTDM